MKTLPLSIALSIGLATLTSTSVQASNVAFKPVDDSFATQVCYVAATDGKRAARKLVNAQGYNFEAFTATVSCNGKSLRQFAREWTVSNIESIDTAKKKVALVAKDSNNISKICLDAVAYGEQAALRRHNAEAYSIKCNDQNLSTFVRMFQKLDVEIKDATE